MGVKKYKLTGKQLARKIKRESLTLDDLIEQMVWFRDHYKKNGWHLPVKIEVQIYNEDATKSCTGVLDSWAAGGSITKNDNVLTLTADCVNPDLVDVL